MNRQELITTILDRQQRRRFPKAYRNYNAHVVAWVNHRIRLMRRETELV